LRQDSLIEVIDVSYHADEHVLLDRVSWQINAGGRWAVLGANGSGKTLLLRIASGWLWPNAGGEVRRKGETLTDLRELRRSIGWVSSGMIGSIPHREPTIDTVVSGRFAQIGLWPVEWERPTTADYQQAQAYLSELGAGELAERPFGLLSQGEQQKALLARARMAQPMLIVLDEPCGGLDPGARERFLEELGRYLERVPDLAFIFVTHHLEEILPQVDQTLVLSEGRVVLNVPTNALLTEQTLEKVYGRRPRQIIESAGRFWPIW